VKRPEISSEFAGRLGTDPAGIKFRGYSQNFVFEFIDRRGASRILRMTPESHRSLPEIENELDFVRYLRGAGLSVCAPVEFEDGAFVQSVSGASGVFHAVVFEKAAGRPLTKEDMVGGLYALHGRHLGRMHKLSKEFPRERLGRRKKWDEERYFTSDIGAYLPADVRKPVRDVWEKLRALLNGLGTTRECFGPVHLDLGYSNFFINGDRLETFDFDNCTNGFYASDIAAALYSSVFNVLRCGFPGDRSAFENPKTGINLAMVWEPFREGYGSENVWKEDWDRQMGLWFQVMYLRSVVHAFRLQHRVTDTRARALLDADIENVLAGAV